MALNGKSRLNQIIILLLCFLCVITFSSCRPRWESDNARTRIEAVRKLTNKKKLEKIALNATHVDVRMEAVKKIKNQDILAQIALSDSSTDVRNAAAEKIEDQKILSYIVFHRTGEICLIAVKKLDDEELLKKIAISSFSRFGESVRGEALIRLKDTEVLTRMAVQGGSSLIHEKAVARLEELAQLKPTSQEQIKQAFFYSPNEVKEIAVHYIDDQATLADIAMNGPTTAIKKAAINRLTDQALLNKIITSNSPKEYIEIAQAKLSGESLETNNRDSAVSKITDQAILSKMALEDKDDSVRSAAVRKLKNQSLLAQIALQDKSQSVRESALLQVEDQKILVRSAVNVKDPIERVHALLKVGNPKILSLLAKDDRSLLVRKTAIALTEDQELLKWLMLNDPEVGIRLFVLKRIKDESFIYNIVNNDISPSVRRSGLFLLKDTPLLQKVGKECFYAEIREKALERLKGRPERDVLVKAQLEISKFTDSLKDESDQNILFNLTVKGKLDVWRAVAAERLTNPALLEKATQRLNHREILKIILSKIDDKQALMRIAMSAPDPAMRIAASVKSGQSTWSQIFERAAKSTQKNREALAAVSLFKEAQPGQVTTVKSICRSLIRAGDESSIPVLIDILKIYGNRSLAVDYLNCGHPDLSTAGNRWAVNHGLSVFQTFGSPSPFGPPPNVKWKTK